MSHKTLRTILLLAFVGIIILIPSCNKRDSQCEFDASGKLKLINSGKEAGECYYLEKGKRVFLEKEDCAWYCN